MRLLALPMLLALATLAACRQDPDDFKPEPVDTGGISTECEEDGDGFCASEGDCDDSNAEVNPGATELCNGIDDNCDGTVDEGASGIYYRDTDADGFGDATEVVEACDAPDGYVASATDCNDADATIYPGAEEPDCTDPVDYNCDGSVGFSDADGDGSPACEDCDDADATVLPGAAETCDDRDEDCDGLVDEDVAAPRTWYADADGDGWGDDAVTASGCDAPEGYVASPGDCQDADATTYPGAAEPDCADPTDHNCDGSVGYADADGDGVAACLDCDDTDATAFPGGIEVCDGADDDCDGTIDNGAADAATWYADTDADGYGDAAASSLACDAPTGSVADATDCDDRSVGVNPGAAEACNGIDDDCDGVTDEDGASGGATWYADTDGDGYGDPVLAGDACEAPAGYVAEGTDCDDIDPTVFPGAAEVCDGADQDCDGTVDDDPTDGTTYWLDDDCDGDGAGASVTTCASPGDDWVAVDGDCDDADSRSYGAGVEVCDGADNDCDGSVDEACEDATLIGPPTGGDPVDGAATPAACGLIGEMAYGADVHDGANLPTYMAFLDGTAAGLVASTVVDADVLDYSARCGTDTTASVGNFEPTTPWPTLAATSTAGAARFRGYLNIGCDDALDVTLGLIGNDAVSLSIEGATIVEANWGDGQWKKFRYVSFPGPGLYAFEVQWQTNLICDIDPFELVWAPGFVAGYDEYDTMCAFAACTYGDGVEVPGFTVLDGDHLVQTPSGAASTCAQCDTDADCGAGTCNTAGLCE